MFRATQAGDLDVAKPMKTLKLVAGASHRKACLKQRGADRLLKRVLVDADGTIYRATFSEIMGALQDVQGVDARAKGLLRGLTAKGYILAVKKKFADK